MSEYLDPKRVSPSEKFPLKGAALMKVAHSRGAILKMSEQDVRTAASEMIHNLVYASEQIMILAEKNHAYEHELGGYKEAIYQLAQENLALRDRIVELEDEVAYMARRAKTAWRQL